MVGLGGRLESEAGERETEFSRVLTAGEGDASCRQAWPGFASAQRKIRYYNHNLGTQSDNSPVDISMLVLIGFA